ncbi:PLP-dependent aminotransferase family protein [Loktanella salsilacus]|uniref:aminotransferase-like domain-containing protein n=1 Tax=Loktanella salsilacus TaxID=195913 RepID=UPI003736F30E
MIVSDTKWTPELSLGGARSKYEALAHAIREGVLSGQLPPGSQLPPVRDLAFRVGVTPGTVARAYRVLIDDRILVAGVGRGTFVADRPAHVPPGLTEDIAQNMAPSLLADFHIEQIAPGYLVSPRMPDMGQAALMARVLAEVAAQPEQLLMRYPSRTTDAAARAAFHAVLDTQVVGPANVEDIVLSHGGQNAVVMIMQTVLHGPSPVILVDELSYNGFRSAAELCRAEVYSVPWDDDGPEVEVFAQLVRHHRVQLYCTAAEVCNPTTRATSPARRAQIAAIAQRHGVHVIDDDCYSRTQRIGPSYRALLPELGWYVTSPSKSLTPALRIGFVVAPQTCARALVRTATGHSFGVSQLVCHTYAHVMAAPELPGIIAAVTGRIAQDVASAVQVLDGYDLAWADGAPFVWLTLPAPWRAGAFVDAAKSCGIVLKSAEAFVQRDSRMVHAVRIAVNGEVGHDAFHTAMIQLRGLLDAPPARIAV